MACLITSDQLELHMSIHPLTRKKILMYQIISYQCMVLLVLSRFLISTNKITEPAFEVLVLRRPKITDASKHLCNFPEPSYLLTYNVNMYIKLIL